MSLADLSNRITALAETSASAMARYGSLYDQGHATEDVAEMRAIVADLGALVEEIRPLAAEQVALRTSLDEAAMLLDELDTRLSDASVPDVEEVLATIADFSAWLDDVAASVDAPAQTLSARVSAARARRAAEDEMADDEAAAADGADAGAPDESETEGEVFDPMAFTTVEEVAAERERYVAAIEQLQSDIAAYEEVISQLDAREEELANGDGGGDAPESQPADAGSGDLPVAA